MSSLDPEAGFLQALERHRLLPIAACDQELSSDLREAAGARHSELASSDAKRDREQSEVLSLLAEVLPAPWVCVQGSDFRERLYPSSLLRPMDDVDILIPRDRTSALLAILAEHGFARVPSPAIFDGVVLRVPPGVLRVELYRQLADATRVDIDYDEIWRERERGEDRLPRMAMHHALAAHTLLLASLQFRTHARKFLDLWLLSRDPEVVMGALECARRWNIRRSFYASYRVMRRLFPEIGAEPWYGAVESLVSRRERVRLDGVFAGAPFAAMPSRPVQVWRKLLLLDSPRHRVRFVVAHVGKVARLALRH